jgi:beta-galactosidase
VILSEYGAEGNVLQQSENPPQHVNPVSGQFFPEQLETRSHEIQWGIIQKNPGLIGSYLWNMFDFAVPLWSRGGVPARNMKGLVTFDRKIKKDAFYWYKANWSKEPVLYISDRRLIMRKNAVTDITVYSNRGVPALTMNGKPVKGVSSGTTRVHFIFKNITLQKGKNIIQVAVEHNGHKYSDEVEWTLE